MISHRGVVTIQYHFDALAIWLNRLGFVDQPGKHSRGLFGVDVAAPRLLELHNRLDLPATWFIPGHTIESFPEICGEIWDRGYDIQHHGWSHKAQADFPDKAAVREDMVRAVDAIRDLTGRQPTGYSSNRWGMFTADTIDLLIELGFDWDSSMMGREFTPYYVRTGWEAPTDGPYVPGEETELLEFPVSWRRDDWPHLVVAKGVQSFGLPMTDKELVDSWRAQFDWMYENVEGGVFNLTLHPQIIAQAPIPGYLESLFDHMRSKEDVVFTTFQQLYDQISG